MFDTIGKHISLTKSRSTESLGLICPSMINKYFAVYLFTRSHMWVDLHAISEEIVQIFSLVELHGIQKKCDVNDNKTKRQRNSNFLLGVSLF